jgi:hypothetical protein
MRLRSPQGEIMFEKHDDQDIARKVQIEAVCWLSYAAAFPQQVWHGITRRLSLDQAR